MSQKVTIVCFQNGSLAYQHSGFVELNRSDNEEEIRIHVKIHDTDQSSENPVLDYQFLVKRSSRKPSKEAADVETYIAGGSWINLLEIHLSQPLSENEPPYGIFFPQYNLGLADFTFRDAATDKVYYILTDTQSIRVEKGYPLTDCVVFKDPQHHSSTTPQFLCDRVAIDISKGRSSFDEDCRYFIPFQHSLYARGRAELYEGNDKSVKELIRNLTSSNHNTDPRALIGRQVGDFKYFTSTDDKLSLTFHSQSRRVLLDAVLHQIGNLPICDGTKITLRDKLLMSIVNDIAYEKVEPALFFSRCVRFSELLSKISNDLYQLLNIW